LRHASLWRYCYALALAYAQVRLPAYRRRWHIRSRNPRPSGAPSRRPTWRKAVRDEKLDKDPVLNARVDAVMAAVGAAVATVDPRFADASVSGRPY